MDLSDFGKRFQGYSGITHLMDDLSEGLAQPGMVMLGGGNPANIPEVTTVFEGVIEKLQASGKLVETLANYDGPQGKSSFIEALAGFFQQQYGWKISNKNIALTHGSQSSFFILFNSFAGKAGPLQKRVLIPLVPEYIGYSDVGIEDGLITSQQARIERLEDGFFKYQVDFDNLQVDESIGLICVSRPTNPSGNVLTDDECRQLDQIARNNEVPLMIDNAYGTPFPNIIFNDANPFWNDNCIVCMSLSKLGLPGARTGIVIASEELIRFFSNMTAITSLAPSGLGAEIVNQLIADGVLLTLCDDIIRPFYKRRSELAVRLLRAAIDDPRLLIHKPEGSMFLWLWFEGLGVTTSELYQRLKRKGLLVVPGKYFFPGQAAATDHAEGCVRMNYVQSEADLEKGIQILARELRACW
ncbi:MAG: valine--pyruvate transaminase [Gammaproteobacteria bacterium]|nr:valine--pyruvate transaminase [Gammaproteobacteria bacterium]MDH3536118.1 valine--pyruvate transaminase [Gammaproteobacteria bacterium]